MSAEAFLQVNNLKVEYITKEETVYAVNDVSFQLEKGKVLGLVGETGAGKTTIARTILRVLQSPPGTVMDGSIKIEGVDVLKLSEEEMEKIRGKKITMIFQDPMTSLNPVMTVGEQISEVIALHNDIPSSEVRKRAEEMLETVGIPAERYDEYPHQFSGGMKQRVVIAIALACEPDLLLADEPTTALDVTIQAQVLELMKELNKKNNTTTILITHDLGVVAEMCDDVAVIYAGEVVESGKLEDIFLHPAHPYTVGLFGALPRLDEDVEWLSPIEGLPPDPTDLPEGCKFSPRCPNCTKECRHWDVHLDEIAPGHFVRCIHAKGEDK
ncbi:MAG: ABC transporter ATP-binding protein [Lachnospiraceae bacterium]|nr:ABC transporter ATP-binding protein [Lachnospiraceae bacterium]